VGGACVGCAVAWAGILEGCDPQSSQEKSATEGTVGRELTSEAVPKETGGVDGSAEIVRETEPAQDLGAEPSVEGVQDGSAEALPEPKAEPVIETPPIDLSGRKYKEVDLNKEPDMSKIGWYINVLLPNEDLVYLFRRTSTTLSSVSGTCTHNGCFVGWRSPERRFVCPCHMARFTQDGAVIDGPAPRALKSYETAWDAQSNIAYIFLD